MMVTLYNNCSLLIFNLQSNHLNNSSTFCYYLQTANDGMIFGIGTMPDATLQKRHLHFPRFSIDHSVILLESYSTLGQKQFIYLYHSIVISLFQYHSKLYNKQKILI